MTVLFFHPRSFFFLLIIQKLSLKSKERKTHSGQIQKMAANNPMEARSPIPWSTICETAKGSISASLESENSVKSIIEAASSANAAAASSASEARVAHAARHASRAARAIRANNIKAFAKTTPLIRVREEASNLVPTTNANGPAGLLTTGTSDQSVFANLGGSDRSKVSNNRSVIFWIAFLMLMIGLIIAGLLIQFFARWLRERRLLSRLHAPHQEESSGTPSGGRNADVPSPVESFSSGSTITPTRYARGQLSLTGEETIG